MTPLPSGQAGWMTRLLFAVILAALACGASAERILFVGNSYTYVNDLPRTLKEIVASTGATAPEVKSATAGGFRLEQHLKRPETLAAIDEGNWDVVIVQGHSMEAARADKPGEDGNAGFLKNAAALCDRIRDKSPNARIVIYETWSRHADFWNSDQAASDIGRNPTEMQANIRKSCQRAAAQRERVTVAPVGDAWELNYKSDNALRLHAKDNSHPDANGTYLAGLVIYATIYHPASLTVPYHAKLPDADAARLQQLATDAMKPKQPAQ